MKKIILFVLTLFVFIVAMANPLPVCSTSISKLSFNQGTWKLVISYYQVFPTEFKIDSIQITSTTDTAMLKQLNLSDDIDGGFITITADSLDCPFNINPEGDIIVIAGFTDGLIFNDSYVSNELRFGNVGNSMIRKPNEDECIISVSFGPVHDLITDKFIICPTNLANEKGDTCFCDYTLKGKIYNTLNQPQIYGSFWLDNWFEPDSLGNYEVNVFDYPHNQTSIFCQNKLYDRVNDMIYYFQKYVGIETIAFTLSGITQIEADIHLQAEIPSAIKEQEYSKYSVFPNPTSNRFIVKGLFNTPTQCVILDLKGTEVARYVLAANSTEQTIQLPESIMSGIYMLNLIENNQLVYSQKMVVNLFR
jgi:hypothetical protein